MMNNLITEMKKTVEGIKNRIAEAVEWISELEDRMVEITAAEQNIEKRMKKNEDSLRDLTHQQSHHRGPRRRRQKERP